MSVRLAIHYSILPSSGSGAFNDVRLEEEMDEQNQIRAEEPTPEQRSVFTTSTVGGLGQEGWEVGVVACLGCGQTGSWSVKQPRR